MKKVTDKIRLYRDTERAFYALCGVLFPNDEKQRRGMSQHLLDVCEETVMGLSIQMARLTEEIGTDNL